MNAFIRFVLWVLVIGGAICGIGYYSFFDVWTVPGDDPRLAVSIQPTLMVGDVLLVKRHSTPVAGDLLRCADPDEPRRFVIGRMAVGGGSSIRINGQHFSTPGSRPTGSGSCPSSGLSTRLRATRSSSPAVRKSSPGPPTRRSCEWMCPAGRPSRT